MELSERIANMTDEELGRVLAKLEAERGTWHDDVGRNGLVTLLRLERERRGRHRDT